MSKSRLRKFSIVMKFFLNRLQRQNDLQIYSIVVVTFLQKERLHTACKIHRQKTMIEGLPTLFLTALLVHSVVSASLIPNSNETVLRIAPTFFQSMRTSMSLRQSTLPWRKILKSKYL